MSMLINLLPDLRQAKLRDRHRRQLVTGISVALWIGCGVIVGVMLVIQTGQKVVISAVCKSIKDKQAQLESVDGLVNAITAQQHLAALPGLYDKRVYLSKFFTAYSASSPSGVNIVSIAIDSSNILTVRGSAPTYAEIAKLARALSGSNVVVGAGAAPENSHYFSDVNIVSAESSDKTGISFTINATIESGATSGN